MRPNHDLKRLNERINYDPEEIEQEEARRRTTRTTTRGQEKVWGTSNFHLAGPETPLGKDNVSNKIGTRNLPGNLTRRLAKGPAN